MKIPIKVLYWRRMLILFVLVSFLFTSINVPFVCAKEFSLPAPGVMVPLSPAFGPAVLKGIKLDPKDPFRFHFFVDRGDSALSQAELKSESSRLIKYFLTSLTIPESDLWVNLSPYEKDRIIPQSFGQTEMGRDLLAQDYILKQITASLVYPENKLGQEFWQKVYAQALAQYGTTDIPMNTFNKVWIVPQRAVVYENNATAFVLENHLKVMLEEDYLAMSKHVIVGEGSKHTVVGAGSKPAQKRNGLESSPTNINQSALPLGLANDASIIGANIIRQIVIPSLTKEVNEGKNFAPLRQVFYSLILAAWYKKKLKSSILNKVYSNRHKVQNLSFSNASIENLQSIYRQYLQAFKKGVFNYIKEEPSLFANGEGGHMDVISEKIVEQTWNEVAGTSIQEAPKQAQRFQKLQPFLSVYLLGAGGDDLTRDEREVLFYVGMVVWRIMAKGNKKLTEVSGETIDKFENSNWEMVEYFAGEKKETDFIAQLEVIMGKYNQKHVLKYVLEALMERDSDDAILRDDKIGEMFIYLKTVVDCLDQ